MISFALSTAVARIGFGSWHVDISGRLSLSAMLVFAATGHFAFNKGMSMMVPNFIPFKSAVVYITGLIELGFAAAVFIPGYRLLAGWMLIVFLALLLPSNILAAVRRIDYQDPGSQGSGVEYLWFRVPLQLLFVIWTYIFCIKL